MLPRFGLVHRIDKNTSGLIVMAKTQKAMADHSIITILINQALFGESFNAFIQNINQPAIVIFDEFEKVYSREDQTNLLTIFDGTFPSKKLFLLTCNESHRVDSYMHNRPGRIFYSLAFGSLDSKFVEEYCLDNLKNLNNLKGIVVVSNFFSEFSFDMLQALVEEMNRYGETATQSMAMLNMKPHLDNDGIYDAVVIRDGKKVTGDYYYNEYFTGSPLTKNGLVLTVGAYDVEEGATRNEGNVTNDEEFTLNHVNIVSIDVLTGTFVFSTDCPNTKIHCKRRLTVSRNFNYDAM
jgi:hypothetical protein